MVVPSDVAAQFLKLMVGPYCLAAKRQSGGRKKLVKSCK
jgi:hypothetical protein